MKERPIPFSGAMVRAILAGTKTQTRRILKPKTQPWLTHFLEGGNSRADYTPHCGDDGDPAMWWWLSGHQAQEPIGRCPYGVPGDRLWVRERCYEGTHSGGRPWVRYAADDKVSLPEGTRWRPSIHMHRWASRIDLETTEVRVQRLQDLSLDDARAEGIPQTAGEAHVLGLYDMAKEPGHEWDNRTSVENYARLWDQINGAGSWDVNPWVWAVSFKRVRP